MKLGLISDIHGNLHALNEVLAQLDGKRVDLILCAGDLVCYGADHEAVLRILAERHIPCVSGNYDYAVAWDQPRASEKLSTPITEPLKRAALEWTQKHISPEGKSFLKSLPSVGTYPLDGCSATVFHATPDRLDQELLPPPWGSLEPFERVAERFGSDIVVMGHTHRPFSLTVRNTLFINPGAVGRSINRNPRAVFAILEVETLEIDFNFVDYDLAGAVQSIRNSEMPKEIAALVAHSAGRYEEVGCS